MPDGDSKGGERVLGGGVLNLGGGSDGGGICGLSFGEIGFDLPGTGSSLPLARASWTLLRVLAARSGSFGVLGVVGRTLVLTVVGVSGGLMDFGGVWAPLRSGDWNSGSSSSHPDV